MAVINIASEVPKSIQWLRRLSRISAWLLLATVAVLVVSGWGITHTDVIYKATFSFNDRGLADSIHRCNQFAVNVFLPESRFDQYQVIVNGKKNKTKLVYRWCIIIVGLALLGVLFT